MGTTDSREKRAEAGGGRTPAPGTPAETEAALDRLCADLLAALQAFEDSQRGFFPGAAAGLRETFRPVIERLDASLSLAELRSDPPGAGELRNGLMEASRLCLESLRLSTASDHLEASLGNYRKAGRRVCRALEILYPLHRLAPAIHRFFLEEPLRGRPEEHLPVAQGPPAPGLRHIGMEQDPYARGSLSLYVPESVDGPQALPLVVALHGGFGHGRDFIWVWLREARSRRFLLAAPSSRGPTWSITGPDADAELLQALLGYIRERWPVDERKILLTATPLQNSLLELYGLVSIIDDCAQHLGQAKYIKGSLKPT